MSDRNEVLKHESSLPNSSEHDELVDEEMQSERRTAKFRRHVSERLLKLEASFRPKRMRIYSPPQQRQRWGETQCLPRVNWGDLFFDLFFVAATYEVSLIFGADPSWKGLLYAAGTFFPVLTIWSERMWYDARFVHDDDLVHRFLEICMLVIVSTTILHIRSVSILSNAQGQVSMFAFSTTLVLERFFTTIRYAEVYWFGVGDPAGMKGSVQMLFKSRVVQSASYLAAACVSGVAYFQEGSGSATTDSEVAHRRIADSVPATDYVSEVTNDYNTNLPIWLCFGGALAATSIVTIEIQFFLPNDGSHKNRTVPMNVDFMIHRNGEWTMLMLGESVFSLLITGVPSAGGSDFYITFFCGILTVVLLQYLHFRSQPHHADNHALRRKKGAGIWWENFNTVYGLFLVCLGSGYTFFLSEYLTTTTSESNDRRLQIALGTEMRLLADSSSNSYDPAEFSSRSALLFGLSLAIIFVCLDAMTLLHLGIHESKDRCVCPQSKNKNKRGIGILVLRLGSIALTATLGVWSTHPATLSILGVACVSIQILFRKLGSSYLSHSGSHVVNVNPVVPQNDNDDDASEASWPNVTHARAISNPVASVDHMH